MSLQDYVKLLHRETLGRSVHRMQHVMTSGELRLFHAGRCGHRCWASFCWAAWSST